MRWRVVWKPEAERSLTAIWLSTEDRELIADAAYELDEILALDPENAGESRDENERVVLIPPLGASITIYHISHAVVVRGVWEF